MKKFIVLFIVILLFSSCGKSVKRIPTPKMTGDELTDEEIKIVNDERCELFISSNTLIRSNNNELISSESGRAVYMIPLEVIKKYDLTIEKIVLNGKLKPCAKGENCSVIQMSNGINIPLIFQTVPMYVSNKHLAIWLVKKKTIDTLSDSFFTANSSECLTYKECGLQKSPPHILKLKVNAQEYYNVIDHEIIFMQK